LLEIVHMEPSLLVQPKALLVELVVQS
jgi:hypothetical protein